MAELAERESQNDRRLSRVARLSGEGELQIQVVSTLTLAASSCLVLLFLSWLCERNACPICLWSFLFATKGPTVVVLIDSWPIWSHTHEDAVLGRSVRAFPGELGWEGKTYTGLAQTERDPTLPACLHFSLSKYVCHCQHHLHLTAGVGTAEASSFVDWVLCSPRM